MVGSLWRVQAAHVARGGVHGRAALEQHANERPQPEVACVVQRGEAVGVIL